MDDDHNPEHVRAISHMRTYATDQCWITECGRPSPIPLSEQWAECWDEVNCDACLRVLADRRAKMNPEYYRNLRPIGVG